MKWAATSNCNVYIYYIIYIWDCFLAAENLVVVFVKLLIANTTYLMCCSWWGSVRVMVLFGGSLLFRDLPLHKDRIVDWPSQSNCGLLGGNRALHTYGWGWSWSSVPRLGILPVLLFNRPFSDHRCGSPWSPCRLGWCSRVRQMFKSSSFLASHKGAISFRKVIFTSYVFVDLKWGFKSSRPKKYRVIYKSTMYTSYSVWSVGYAEPGSPRLSLSSSVGARYLSSISVCIRRMRSSWTLIGNTAPKDPFFLKKTLQSDYVYWSRWLESSLPSQWCELGVQYIEIPGGQSHTSTCYCSIDGTAWQIYDCKHKSQDL